MEFFDWLDDEDNQVDMGGELDIDRVEPPFERCLRRYTIFNKVYGKGTIAEFMDNNLKRKLLMEIMMSSFAKCVWSKDYNVLIQPGHQ